MFKIISPLKSLIQNSLTQTKDFEQKLWNEIRH